MPSLLFGGKMKIGFYFVESEYIKFLKEREVNFRGFTTVPNVVYHSREKFLFGEVLEVGGMSYLVPVSSYTKKQQDNFLIEVSDHHKNKVAGSLRFNYMIPVPAKCLKPFDFKRFITDENRRNLIEKEYRYCKKKIAVIQKQAKKTYERVTNKTDENLVKNSCDFKLLEQAYAEYMEAEY